MVRAAELIPGGVNSPVRSWRSVGGTPFVTQRAIDCRLQAVDGREFLDYVCTWGPAIHGHNHPTIREAIAEALENGTSFGTPNPYEVPMAERIVSMVPSIEKVRLVNSGTEATMSTIRLARGFTKREKIIKFAGCYHGHVDSLLVKAGSGALTLGNPDSAGVTKGTAADTIVLPFNDTAALEQAFAKAGKEIAAVIVEPYPANAGLILPEAGFLEKLRAITQKHDALLIFDEVMTGFRLARGGVQEVTGVTPDLTALGKIIGGGLPVGAFGGRAEIMEHLAPLGPVYQAGTLSGNPLAMAAGIASLDLLIAEDPYEDLQKKGEYLRETLLSAAKARGEALQVPQTGSMFALFFMDRPVRNVDDAAAANQEKFRKFFHGCLERGVYLPPSNFETSFLSTAHNDAALERTAGVFAEVMAEV